MPHNAKDRVIEDAVAAEREACQDRGGLRRTRPSCLQVPGTGDTKLSLG